MFDRSTGWKVGVASSATDGAYIIVSRPQVGTVCGLLSACRVPYCLEGFVPDPHGDNDPIEAVIRLGNCVQEDRVQAILDRVP